MLVEAVVLLVGMVDLVVTVVVLVLQANRDQVQIVVQVEQNIMTVVYQQQVSYHQGQQVVR